MPLFTTDSRKSHVSANRRQTYFVHSTPKGLDGAQFIAVNRDGSVIYGLRIRVELSIIEMPDQVPEVITTATEKTICKYHIASGNSKTFQLDYDFDPLVLTRILEFYTITDNLVVLLAYDPEHYQFSQTVVFLDQKNEWAHSVAVRRKTVSRMSSPPLVNLSFLDKGRVLLCGARASEAGVNERMTLSIAADPLNSFEKPDDDLSGLMEDFNKFLISLPPDRDGKTMISLFLLNLDQEKISILLSEVDTLDPQSEPEFTTSRVGIIDRKNNNFSVEKVDNTVISAGEPLKVTSIANMKTKNGSVWMSFSVTDVELLKTVYWRFKHLYVRIMLRLMILGFHGSLYLWKFDNGLAFYCLTRVLIFLHGPTMIPVYSPQKKFFLCHLNIQKRRFYKIEHSARILKNKRDPNETDFALNFDVDSSGGSVVIDYPTEEEQRSQMAVNYFPNPTIPQSLAKMSTYTAYKNYPAFEKSSLLRRLTGVIGWKWDI